MMRHLQRVLGWVALALVLALPVRLFVGELLALAFFLAALGAIAWIHCRNFARLERWTAAPFADESLEGDGAWNEIFSRLYRHEKELRQQIAQRDEEIAHLMAAGQALTDGVVLLDRYNHILFCNQMAETQLGLVVRTDRGQHIANLVRQPEFVDYLEQGEFLRPLILRSDRREGCVYSIHVIVYGADRRLMQIQDVTQTDRIDRMRRDFVANVSHELRTPLTVLAGFVETMQELALDEADRARYLAMMGEQSQRMLSIVQDLLTLSSIESAPPPADEVVDMAMMLNRLHRDAEALSAGRHVIELESDARGDLLGSESELNSAFGNLVSNAVRYTPAGGRIRLIWHAGVQGGMFAVEDSGIGIAAEHLPRLTERFYRVDRGRSREVGGTGLGLAIVKHALNRHQAHLEVSSELGRGSRFAACFPAARITAL